MVLPLADVTGVVVTLDGASLCQRASTTREETTITTVGKLILTLHLVFGPRTTTVMMTSQSKKNEFFSSGTNLQMSPL